MDEGSADPTQVAAELTELAGVAEADTQSAYAWSEDDDPEVEPESNRPFWVTSAAIAVSLSLVTVAAVLGYRYVTDEQPAPVAVSAPTTTSAPSPIAAPPLPSPPPVTVTTVIVQSTIQAPPPKAEPAVAQEPGIIPPAQLAELDRRFVASMEAQGAVIEDPKMLAFRAHQTCAKLQAGYTDGALAQQLMQEFQLRPTTAVALVQTAMATYPDCP